jgi:hypothetical protein
MLIYTIPLLDEFQDDISPFLSNLERVESFFVYFLYIFCGLTSFFCPMKKYFFSFLSLENPCKRLSHPCGLEGQYQHLLRFIKILVCILSVLLDRLFIWHESCGIIWRNYSKYGEYFNPLGRIFPANP